MSDYCMHKEIVWATVRGEYYLFTCSISDVSSISSLKITTEDFKMKSGCTYTVVLTGSKDDITLKLMSESTLKCSVSMFIGSKTLLVSEITAPVTENPPVHHSTYGFYGLPHVEKKRRYFRSDFNGGENMQKLKQHPNEALVIICRIKYENEYLKNGYKLKTPSHTLSDGFNNLKKLAFAFQNSSESLQEKVMLSDGKETEAVSKAVLFAHSPVFAKMFENDMKERNNNAVTITDIKMPVIKALVSFLYAGVLPKYNFHILCDLFYAADKYNISGLRQLCVNQILPKVSMDNILRATKLAFTHNIEELKLTVLMHIVENFETLVLTKDWRRLLESYPEIASEIKHFCDF